MRVVFLHDISLSVKDLLLCCSKPQKSKKNSPLCQLLSDRIFLVEVVIELVCFSSRATMINVSEWRQGCQAYGSPLARCCDTVWSLCK